MGHSNDKKSRPSKVKSDNSTNKKSSYSWVVVIVIWTFILSMFISFIASTLMGYVSLGMAFIVLIVIILLGIIFDVIGIAVTAASERPFHSMGAQKIDGARQTIKLIRNADKVSNFCNDVVGDIAGIISGATSATIVTQLARSFSLIDAVTIGLILTGFVASLTVGGKAVGKSVAIANSNTIIYKVGLLIYYFETTIKQITQLFRRRY
ncbi:MAG: hypothetical protein MJB12_19820 [Firmicutes bacterium]|nr:hypothetical protein [Bacillota bacterium]